MKSLFTESDQPTNKEWIKLFANSRNHNKLHSNNLYFSLLKHRTAIKGSTINSVGSFISKDRVIKPLFKINNAVLYKAFGKLLKGELKIMKEIK